MHDNPEAHTESSSLAQFACITEFKERQTVNTAQCNNGHLNFQIHKLIIMYTGGMKVRAYIT
jgi:hypothetical protein